MTEKFEKIITKVAKEMVHELSEEELDYYFFCTNNKWIDLKIRTEVIKSLPKDDKLVHKIAIWDSDYRNRLAAIERIDDEKVLERIVCSDSNAMCQRSAIKKITDSKRLLKIIIYPNLPYIVKKLGVENINGQREIEQVAMRNSEDCRIRVLAIKKMLNKELLEKLQFCDDCYDIIKEEAEARLKELV